ncbi:hypothetical protein ACFFJT_13570 [Dyella flava]|uniref:Uncharacterized protein n=1 Tax=Dyella flava TaxID=1920170 RepID=A0ABS2K093_9GAMM|nr:hypothetical protein [Dyella flava]MBM7124309.1 hypothetical protein [Dyella flava]GLQ52390.1 hypothetical protein GCM10010872_38390 [Dyella flava]
MSNASAPARIDSIPAIAGRARVSATAIIATITTTTGTGTTGYGVVSVREE